MSVLNDKNQNVFIMKAQKNRTTRSFQDCLSNFSLHDLEIKQQLKVDGSKLHTCIVKAFYTLRKAILLLISYSVSVQDCHKAAGRYFSHNYTSSSTPSNETEVQQRLVFGDKYPHSTSSGYYRELHSLELTLCLVQINRHLFLNT